MLPSDLLLRDGWTRYHIRQNDEGRCLLGTIWTSQDMATRNQDDPHYRILDEVRSLIGGGSVMQWNDTQCPDAATAVALLRRAEINCGLRPVAISSHLTGTPRLEDLLRFMGHGEK